MKSIASWLLMFAAFGVIEACRSHQGSGNPPLTPAERGVASWYGDRHQGRLTASGAVFDMNKQTAAHRTFPFGTRLRVHDTTNGRNVEVEVNDRGPFVKQRIIDLSRSAASAVDLIQRGTTTVELVVLRKPVTRETSEYAVQIAMMESADEAEALRRQMDQQFGSARVIRYDAEPILWRVLVGREPSVAAAEALSARIARQDSVVVLIDPE